jgi:heme/copper-type cytochrome/quinol oxidase subunit 1
MSTTGMPVMPQLLFMRSTMRISVPTDVKVFHWIATLS